MQVKITAEQYRKAPSKKSIYFLYLERIPFFCLKKFSIFQIGFLGYKRINFPVHYPFTSHSAIAFPFRQTVI